MKRILCALIAVAWSSAAFAVEPPQKCQASKLQTAGKYGACRLKADSKAAKTGDAPDYSKCDQSFGLKWDKAEATAGTGVCPSEGDESALQAFIIQHADDVAAALAGGALPDCPGDLATCTDDVAECTADLADAAACGNATVDGSEDCDFGDLAGESCVTQGFAGGTLECGSGCVFDTGDCYAARFVDHEDGTVTDNQTGLMWEKKASRDGFADFANLHDADTSYPWAGTCSVNTSKFCQPSAAASALCSAHVEFETTICSECTGGDGTCSATDTVWTWAAALNTGSFAGHTDWRVPTRAELLAIMDYSDEDIAVQLALFNAACFVDDCSDITDPECSCPLVVNGSWTASAYVASAPPGSVWAFSEGTGEMTPHVDLPIPLQVRAVRGSE
jgi:hypothetical protein